MLGQGNQNEFGFSNLNKRPPSIGQIIGHKIKVRRMKKRMGETAKPGQMAGMLSKSFGAVGAQSPKTIRLPGYPSAPGIDKVDPY